MAESVEELLSVIIPVYNSEKYLSSTIDSVLSSTYSNLELILVDDESTDKSPEICDEYAKKDERVRVFHIKHGNRGAARNFGIKHMRGRFLAFVDHDDYVYPEMYEKLIDTIKEQSVDVAVCNFETFDIKKNKIENSRVVSSFGKKPFSEMQKALIKDHNSISYWMIWNKVYDYERILKKTGGKNILFLSTMELASEDRSYLTTLYNIKGFVYIIDEVLYRWNLIMESESHGRFPFEKAVAVIDGRRYDYGIIKDNPDKDLVRAVKDYYLSSMFYFVMNHRNLKGDKRVVEVWHRFVREAGLRVYQPDDGHINPIMYYLRYFQFMIRFAR